MLVRGVPAVPYVLEIVIHFPKSGECTIIGCDLNGTIAGKVFSRFSDLIFIIIRQPFVGPHGDNDRLVCYNRLAFVNIVHFIDTFGDVP